METITNKFRITASMWAVAVAFLWVLGQTGPAFAGTLFIGTDTEEFHGITPDRLGKVVTTGPVAGPVSIIPLDYPLNGLGRGSGFLYAGDPLSNTLRTIDYNGALLSSISAGFSPCGLSESCKNEDMVFDGTDLFHAHWSPTVPPGNIQRVNPANGAVLATYEQNEVIGMTMVESVIWISKWEPKQVGTWDPGTNTFTPIFTTPSRAGGLAYDPDSGVLWVGLEGGNVVPYDLAGNALGAGFQPFGPIADTIDGLELVCELTVTGASATPSVLWPPDHKMVDVTVTYNTTCGGTCTLSVTSNEPVNGRGDGNTSSDWQVVDATHVRLRAERSGTGSGRIYTITITCTDQLGQTSTSSVTVTVPHDQRP